MNDKTIKGIWGIEPRRDGEYPEAYQVGASGVTRIEYVEKNYGTYGIGEFHVYKGDELWVIMMHQAVSSVVFETSGD